MEQEPEATAAFFASIAGVHALRIQLALAQLPLMPRAWRHRLGP
ncbi:hypothetical protein [Streptomyces orinoci]|uniref:Uncharacterized protein n=1 Tax=Streptomyces orinoci TaxID=67339 RepID=A0ABV3JR79_STRON|nr:hypothetical protein [Streptomyces orinoci]